MLSYVVRWLTLPLLAAACVESLGWWRTGVVLLVWLSVARHWFFSLLVAVAGFVWLDVPFSYLMGAVAYRLVWELLLWGSRMQSISSRRHRTRVRRPVPHLRCRHGLGKRIVAADRLQGVGLAGRATDAYLEVLAEHPVEPTCGRPLLLRTAEAARSAGDDTLSAELSAAALRGIPRDPTGRLATIAVRAHATRAAALAGLGDLEDATRSLRRAQRLTQANRATERYLRWTAAEIRLAARRIRSVDEFNEEVADALIEQQLSPSDTSGMNWLTIKLAWRLLGAGDAEGAETAFFSVRRDLNLDPEGREIRRPDGRLRAPAKHQPDWRMFTLAVAGEVAAAAAKNEELSADDRTAADLATDLAWYLDEKLAGARMLLTRALLDHSNGGDAQEAVARLRRAQSCADLGLHTFADHRRQAQWVRLRNEIAAVLQSVAGIDEPPVASPWPVTAKEHEQAEEARSNAEALFDKLAANDPEVFSPARRRLTPRLDADRDDVELRELWETRTEEAAVAADDQSARSEAETLVLAPPAPAPAAPSPVDPTWLEPLMVAAGGRCWTLPLALDQARALGHGHVGPEHLLLAVARDGACAEILAGLGVTVDDLRTMISPWFARTETTAPVVDPELTALAAHAASLGAWLGESRVSAGHLLMALLADPQGAGGAALRAVGADLEEARVRVDAAFAGPVLLDRAGPLFTAGRIIQHRRLTLPAWLAIGWALDLAAVAPGRILGPEYLAAGVHAHRSRVLPPSATDGRATVRIGLLARQILIAARHAADAAGEWGIDLDHLHRVIQLEELAAEPSTRPGTRAACERAARRGAHFVTPEDVLGTSSLEGPACDIVPPVPVLTPAARRAWYLERGTP